MRVGDGLQGDDGVGARGVSERAIELEGARQVATQRPVQTNKRNDHADEQHNRDDYAEPDTPGFPRCEPRSPARLLLRHDRSPLPLFYTPISASTGYRIVGAHVQQWKKGAYGERRLYRRCARLHSTS